MATDASHGGDAGTRIGHDAGPIGVGFAILVAVGRDRFGLCDLMGQHVAERTKLADIELTGTHSFDFGIIACGDKNLNFATDLLAEQRSDTLVDGR